MEQKDESKSNGLENQLRGMILGNVRIADGQASQDTNAQRGRGRGRGGFWRGNNRNHQNRSEQSQEQQTSSLSSSASPRQGGGTDFNNRGYRQHGPQTTPHISQGPGANQRGGSPNAARQQVPRQPRQPPHGQDAATAEPASGAQGPRILHRPHTSTHPTGQVQVSPSTAHHPRQQAPYQPRPHFNQPRENPMAQVDHLDRLAAEKIPKVEMSLAEFEEKEAFRLRLEGILRQAILEGYSGVFATISLVAFGSLASGFGMPGSDMDLAIVLEWKDPSQADEIGIDRGIPRLLERAVLDSKMGGRLLTRTRVPILKVCESPTEALYTALLEERKKWDKLPENEQYPTDAPAEPSPLPKPLVDIDGQKSAEVVQHSISPVIGDDFPELGTAPQKKKRAALKASTNVQLTDTVSPTTPVESASNKNSATSPPNKQQHHQQHHHHHRADKAWVREKILGPLDFPKQGVGIQCDINFDNPLGIHNTRMLRCYSLTDPRVRPIVLFVKAWAKRRKINSSYAGTLSSYGWVLMVLHYLVNIAHPPVCPNLQHTIPQPKDLGQLESFFKDPTVSGYTVRFWRNEQEIIQAAQSGRLSQNRQTVGALLRGFFQYYASLFVYGNNYGPRPPQFYWTNEVLSLRTPGGIRTKQDKGWVSAKTTVTAEKKVTNRYLFAIEDPFELDHNVARTVTHRGIVAIRDDFRRAWRILSAIGRGMEPEGGIFDEVVENPLPPTPKEETKEELKTMGMEDVGINDGEDGLQETNEAIVGL